MAGKLLSGGGTLLGTSSSQSLVASHAVEASNGSLNILLINKDPCQLGQVALGLQRIRGGRIGTTSVYTRRGHVDHVRHVVIVVGEPGVRTRSRCCTWRSPAAADRSVRARHADASGRDADVDHVGLAGGSAAGSHPIAGYRVYRVSGATSTLVGSPTGTSLQVTGLTSNTAYTFDVVAVDSSGATSPPSSQVTVCTGQPANSTCKVVYTVTSWTGAAGSAASIAITNTGTAAVDNWSLQFTWPGNQQVSAGWGGNFGQSGNTVTVTAPSYAPNLAAGATTTPGFNGGYTGTNPKPTAFTLNGQACVTG